MNQLIIHKKIDDFLKSEITPNSFTIANELINHNFDARNYFYDQADERWLTWIWDNDFLDIIVDKSNLELVNFYRVPEIGYLNKMTGRVPEVVLKILLSLELNTENSTPDLVNNLFWIVGLLPYQQLKEILPKIFLENWFALMSPHSKSGYEFEKLVKLISDEKDFESLLILSKIIFTVRDKKEFEKMERFSISDNLFYMKDISASGIFEIITSDNNSEKEDFLLILINTIIEILNIKKWKEETIFEFSEPFYLLDLNIFNVELNRNNRFSSREDIKDFIASIKILIDKIYVKYSDTPAKYKKIYSNEISKLPDSLTSWKLKLYAITRAPHVFKAEIKEFLFRIFNVGEKHYELDSGAEYHEGLIAGFNTLDDKDKRDYVKNVISYFGKQLEDKRKQEFRARDGKEICSYIKKYLTKSEIEAVIEKFGPFLNTDDLKPRPSMGEITSGFVTHKSPVNIADMTISEIITYLKTDGSPNKLSELYKNDNFLNQRGPEGVCEEIKNDFIVRQSEYLNSLNSFFDPEKIHPSYTYAVLQPLENLLRADKKLDDTQVISLFNFFKIIRMYGEKKTLKPLEDDSYLPNWIAVHLSMTNIILQTLDDIKNSEVFSNYQEEIFNQIKYLLNYKYSPDVEDEWDKTSESSHVAINSVRGEAYRAFVQYMYNQGNDSISDEVKNLFEWLIKNETSNAVRFTIGQFFASFYFRDKEFIKNLLPEIFPYERSMVLFFPTWEGYLSSSLYEEIFELLEDYYLLATRLNTNDYPKKKYDNSLDKMLATHLSLAFVHFSFNSDTKLFKLFWEIGNEERHEEFVSFIGKDCFNRDSSNKEWLKENKININKILGFWDWLNTNELIESKTYAGLGMWINPTKEVLDDEEIIERLSISLKKSKGELDWDYGFTRRVEIFAEMDPGNTLEIIRNYLLDNGNLNPNRRMPLFSLDHEIKNALSIIYRTKEYRLMVEDLIGLLIEKGSSTFWGLKTIFNQN